MAQRKGGDVMGRAIIVESEDEAIAIAAKLDAALGLPRCNCPACGGVEWVENPLRPSCTCKGADVDLACPHVTARHSVPIASLDGKSWALPIGDAIAEDKVDARDGAVTEIAKADWYEERAFAADTEAVAASDAATADTMPAVKSKDPST